MSYEGGGDKNGGVSESVGRSKINTVQGALIISTPVYDFLAQVLEKVLVATGLAVGRILMVLGKKAIVAGPIRTKRQKSLSYGPFFLGFSYYLYQPPATQVNSKCTMESF